MTPRDSQPPPTSLADVPGEVTADTGESRPEPFRWRNSIAALRHRNFRLFLSGQIVSLVGTWMQNTAQGWLVYQLTGSKFMLGAVAAAGSAPMLLFSVWGGSVADRHSKRQIVLLTQTVMMLTALTLAALVWGGWVRPWHILLLAGLAGLAMAFDMPARQAFMFEMTSREDLMNAVGLNSSVVNAARVVGPALAGMLMAHAGIWVCFLANGLSFLAVLAGLCLMRLPPFVSPKHPGSGWAHVKEGFHYVWCHRPIRNLLLLFSMVGVFGWSYAVLMPAFARDNLGVGQAKYGVLLAANGAGALLGALTVAALGRHLNRRLLVFGGLWVFSAMLLLLALVRSYPAALALLAIAGWGMLLFFSTLNTLLQTYASDTMRGRVMGIWALIFGGMTPAGGLVAGLLSHWFGVRVAISIGGTICALTGLVTFLLVIRRDANTAQRASGSHETRH